MNIRFHPPEFIMLCVFAALWFAVLAYTLSQGLVGLQPGMLSADAFQYSELGASLIQQGIYSMDGVHPFFEREPGYSLFLALIYGIGGVRNFMAVYIAQTVLHIIAVIVFTRAIAFIVPRRAAYITLGLLLFFPAIFHVLFSLYRESFALSVSLFFASSVLALRRTGKWQYAALAGALLGLFILTYAPLLLFPFFLIVIFLLWRVRLSHIILSMVLCMAVIAPWGIRNYGHTGMTCLTGCYRAALQWYTRGEQAEHLRGFEPAMCLVAEYVTRDYTNRSDYCHFNGVWHRKWPYGFVGVPEDAVIAKEGQQKILQYFPYYLWFSLFEVVELHFPYVNGWGRSYNVLAALSMAFLYLGFMISIPRLRRLEHVFFAALVLYITGVFSLTDALPRYLMPVIFCYMLWAGLGYDRLLHFLWPRLQSSYRHIMKKTP